MTLYTGVATTAAIASAIMAWTARADALSAQKAASTAHERATRIAERSAEAQNRANELTEKHFADRIDLERRFARAQWAALLKGWMLSETVRAAMPRDAPVPSTIRRITFIEVSDARMALNDATAEALQARINGTIRGLVNTIRGLPQADRMKVGIDRSTQFSDAEKMIEAWVVDPAGTLDAPGFAAANQTTS